jgi:hypothetical protein
MLYVGLDMHNTRIAVCALNQTGQVVHRAQVRGIEEVLRALKGLPDRFEVCYEASCAPLDRLAALRMEAEEDLIQSPRAADQTLRSAGLLLAQPLVMAICAGSRLFRIDARRGRCGTGPQ